MDKIRTFLERWWILLVLLAALPFYYSIAVHNEGVVDYVNNGFFTFWLSGQMDWTGGQPYSSADWVGGHHANGATWIPNQIFPYPLPLALLMAPLGLMGMQPAYIALGMFSQIVMALVVLWLATFWEGFNRRVFAVVLLVAVTLNSNIQLMLMTGTISALFLVFLALALYFMQTNRSLAAGLMLSLLALKPPFLVIVALLGLWLFSRKDWKALGGMLLGALALLGIGMLQDPHWVEKFRGASENLFNIRLGNQPTLIGYTRLACGGDLTCALAGYALLALLLTGLFAWLAWKRRDALGPREAFSAAIALGILLPPYLWSYDYALLIIPLCYICFELVQRRESYLYATLFLLVLDGLSFATALLSGNTRGDESLNIHSDMWSIWVAVLVLVVAWALAFRSPARTEESAVQIQ